MYKNNSAQTLRGTYPKQKKDGDVKDFLFQIPALREVFSDTTAYSRGVSTGNKFHSNGLHTCLCDTKACSFFFENKPRFVLNQKCLILKIYSQKVM